MGKLSQHEQAMVDNDVENIVARAINPPPKEESKAEFLPVGQYKFKEDQLLREASEYILNNTSEEDVAMLKIIMDSNHGTGYLVGTIMNVLRKKDRYDRDELLKLMHYAAMLLYAHDKENE